MGLWDILVVYLSVGEGHSYFGSHPRVEKTEEPYQSHYSSRVLIGMVPQKSLLSYISKDVSTSGVTNEEEAILLAQQLDLIYSHSGILYEIILEAPRPTHNVEKPKPRLHVDGVVGSMKSPTVESLAKQLHELYVKHSTAEAVKVAPPP